MNILGLDEIFYISRFLNLKNTFTLVKSLRLENEVTKTVYLKNKKIMVIENLYNSFISEGLLVELEDLIKIFYENIDLEDLICFMANVYPNNPKLKDTILFDVLKLYKITKVNWTLIKTHFRVSKNDSKLLLINEV